jgi:methyl-accepting chemotaxis protein
LSDEKILQLGKKVRAEMVQRNVEVESYRKQKEDIQMQLRQMLKDMQALADGDLTISTKTIDGDLSEVGIFFDDVMRGLQNIVGQVKSSANQVNFSLGQNEQAIANLKSISQRQVDIVERSHNTAQISNVSNTSIVNNSLQVIQTSQLVTEKIADGDRAIDAVMEKVGELQSTVKTTAKRMKHLGESSQKIAKAISTINEIAIKTNFLAINATLEASRTGVGGNGFVMVAEEVGELAAKSVTVTREVEALLGSIQNETNAVMAVVESGANQVGESNTLAIAAKDNLQQIAQISQQIHELMSSISDATLSQVQTSEGIANLMKDIAHIANRTLASSSEASKFLQATRRHSGDLQQSLTYFKTR